MRAKRARGAMAAILLPLVGGCAGEAAEGRPAEVPVPEVNEVAIRAFDYQFEAPESLPAGPTRFRMTNEGPDVHHVQLVRLEGGHSLGDLVGEFRGGHGALPEWAVQVGGPNGAVAGAAAEAVVELVPGEYALLCVVPGPDGVLHVMKGMIRPLRVVPSGAAAVRPRADVEMKLSDYGFEISPAIRAGRREVRVTNAAAQAHEVVVFRLAPGRTAEEVLRWVGTREGVPPGLPVGGATYLSPGEENVFSMDFEPGEYALVCFVPDAGDGRPHFMHGMVRQIRVG